MIKPCPKIAIIGAGFTGLALAWNFLKHPCEVTIFSRGDEASKISAGLLHPYGGLHSKLNPFGNEGMACTKELLDIASNELGESVILSNGLIRLALTDKQKTLYQKLSYPDVEQLSESQVQKLDPLLPKIPGIYIHSAKIIDTSNYLLGLKKACQKKAMVTIDKNILSLRELDAYTHVIVACGAFSKEIFPDLPIHQVRGQLLELRWPSNIPPLQNALSGQVYIAMTENNTRCVVGATYEHDIKKDAVHELMPKALELYPALALAEILEIKEGVRASTPNRLPILKQMSDRHWVLAGMGSKGLLYHGYFANELVRSFFCINT